ncbi:MAG TPA: 4Fe-4S cluster-binding domain-containing protein [Thermoanaerobacterales bacterium]|nr:4Fe-4S cluster-binding domain-containing protein [Thermoanaerobacterales bacterium]
MQSGELDERIKLAKRHLTSCYLCPHECGIDRNTELGICRSSNKAIIASYGPHYGEESVLVGRNGSGTIFFSFCNMKCVFCQNHDISHFGKGQEVTNKKLADIMLNLQNEYKCHNINLVTPTHFVPNILEAVSIAIEYGLKIPLVYNCGGYERIETLKLLDGIIDIYMPDFKYISNERSLKYSKIKDYKEKVKSTLIEMDRQVGGLKTDRRGVAYKGLLVRHLVMPGGLKDTKKILKFIKDELSEDCLVNLMGQYRPAFNAFNYAEISKSLSYSEFKKANIYARELGLRLAT